jgi:membrane protease YdiL (CAAX protease family)
MTQLILDRFGRICSPPAFLAAVGPLERRLPRLAAFLLSGLAASCGAALLVALAIVLCVALPLARQRGIAVPDALQLALDPGPASRSLLSYWYELAVAGLATYAAALAVLGLAMRFYRRSARSFLTAAPRFRWGLVGAGFAIGACTVGVVVLAQALAPDAHPSPPLLQAGESLAARLGYAGLAAGFLYLAAVAEEIVFRGVLLQLSSAFTRSLPLLLAINGVIFSLAHFDPDLSGFVIRAFMGAGWAWIALRSGGIETTAGVHLANNLLISLFVMPVTFQPPAPHGFELSSVLAELAMVLASMAAIEVMVRRRERLGAPSAPQRAAA